MTCLTRQRITPQMYTGLSCAYVHPVQLIQIDICEGRAQWACTLLVHCIYASAAVCRVHLKQTSCQRKVIQCLTCFCACAVLLCGASVQGRCAHPQQGVSCHEGHSEPAPCCAALPASTAHCRLLPGLCSTSSSTAVPCLTASASRV